MIKKITILTALVVSLALAIDSQFNFALTDSSGPSALSTGDPGSAGGKTCSQAGCHTSGTVTGTAPAGTLVVKDLSNNVVTSYSPGTTYNVTVTLNTYKKYGGFQLTVLNLANANIGTFTAGSSSQLHSSNTSYIEHSNSSFTTNTIAWNFQWTAPATNAGQATFYGAFNKADGNFGNQNDTILTTTLTLAAGGTGIETIANHTLSIYPNPVADVLHINALNMNEKATITVYAVDGTLKMDKTVANINAAFGVENLEAGVYFIVAKTESGSFTQKFVKE
jgi:hypothetical protein